MTHLAHLRQRVSLTHGHRRPQAPCILGEVRAMLALLNVPYYIQPTSNWCQSTCLLMISDYLSERETSPLLRRTAIQAIWNDLNSPLPTDPSGIRPPRPENRRNSWANFAWWLKWKHGGLWEWHDNMDDRAVGIIRDSISRGLPVIAGVLHPRTTGHVILIIGVEEAASPTRAIWFYCHDPYGNKDDIDRWGGGRWSAREFGEDLIWYTGRGDSGPGLAVKYDIAGISRQYADGARLRLLFDRLTMRLPPLDLRK